MKNNVSRTEERQLIPLKICVIRRFKSCYRISSVWNSHVFVNTRKTSRVTESRIEARSANLVGETKVDCGDLLFPQMCAGVNASRRTKSPLMAFAQPANRHDAFISISA
jgi:hypothetical protein